MGPRRCDELGEKSRKHARNGARNAAYSIRHLRSSPSADSEEHSGPTSASGGAPWAAERHPPSPSSPRRYRIRPRAELTQVLQANGQHHGVIVALVVASGVIAGHGETDQEALVMIGNAETAG